MGLFYDRADGGRKLAKALLHYKNKPEVLVLGLPRGGMVVAYEIAQRLKAPLDVFVVRKLGVPGQEELAMGAIASGGVRILNNDVVSMLNIAETVIEQVTETETQELIRRETAYRGAHASPPKIEGRTLILVDDGLATGATMRAAVAAVRIQKAGRIVVAVPTGAYDTCEAMRNEVDELICLTMPEPFWGVGAWYDDFSQTTDEEVQKILQKCKI